MSLLSVIQDVISENGFGARPVSIIGNSDALAVQCLALANDSVQQIRAAHNWQSMLVQTIVLTSANGEYYPLENQGEFATFGFDSFVPDAAWDSTNNLPLIGPISEAKYAALKNGNVALTSNTRYWKLAFNWIHIFPIPTVDNDNLTFRFYAKNAVIYYSGVDPVYSERFTQDSATTKFPERLLHLALKYKLRKAKGFDYAEEYNDYKEQLAIAIAKDQSARTLTFGPPGVFALPLGNFPATIETP